MVSKSSSVYDQVVARLRDSPAGLRCEDVESLLKRLRFNVRQGTKGGHRVVTHPGLSDAGFRGSNFNCGHRSTSTVKPAYVRKLLRICEDYEQELRLVLGEP